MLKITLIGIFNASLFNSIMYIYGISNHYRLEIFYYLEQFPQTSCICIPLLLLPHPRNICYYLLNKKAAVSHRG